VSNKVSIAKLRNCLFMVLPPYLSNNAIIRRTGPAVSAYAGKLPPNGSVPVSAQFL